MSVLVLLVHAIYIQEVFLNHVLYVLRLAGCGVDEDSEDPGVAIGCVYVPCEILRAGYGAALGVDTSFEDGLRTERSQGAALAAHG